jgi:hypothetical protein
VLSASAPTILIVERDDKVTNLGVIQISHVFWQMCGVQKNKVPAFQVTLQ